MRVEHEGEAPWGPAREIAQDSWQPQSEMQERKSALGPDQLMASKIVLTPYAFPAPQTIPQREFLYGKYYIRGYVSARFGAGGTAKTSKLVCEVLAMVSGKPVLGVAPAKPLNVFIWNGEDQLDEMHRRVAAAMQFHGLTAEDMIGQLFIESGRDMEIKLAMVQRGEMRILEPVHNALRRELIEKEIDVAAFDPFVSSHSVNENDNGQIDAVVKRWAQIAGEVRCSIDLTHHTRKSNGQTATMEDARGAVALRDGIRAGELLVRMTPDEGKSLGVDEGEVWRYCRIGDVRTSVAPPPALKSQWFKLESVSLPNGREGKAGDSVGVMRTWVPSPLFDGISNAKIDDVMRAVDTGTWAKDGQSADWVGKAIASELKLDITKDVDRSRVSQMLAQWIKSGALQVVRQTDKKTRKDRPFVKLGNWQFGVIS